MSESIELKVSSRKNKDGSEYYEGTVKLPVSNLTPVRLQKADGTTKFSTRSAVLQAARNAGKKLGYQVAEEQQVKQAAKKSPTPSKKTVKKSTTPATQSSTQPWLTS